MATFKNVSGEDREVSVDGRSIFVASGDSFDVDDEFAPTLAEQPHFSEVGSKKPAKQAEPATTEGDN